MVSKGKTVLEQLAEKAAKRAAIKKAVNSGIEESYAAVMSRNKLQNRRLSKSNCRIDQNPGEYSALNTTLPNIHIAQGTVTSSVNQSKYINIDAANYEVIDIHFV